MDYSASSSNQFSSPPKIKNGIRWWTLRRLKFPNPDARPQVVDRLPGSRPNPRLTGHVNLFIPPAHEEAIESFDVRVSGGKTGRRRRRRRKKPKAPAIDKKGVNPVHTSEEWKQMYIRVRRLPCRTVAVIEAFVHQDMFKPTISLRVHAKSEVKKIVRPGREFLWALRSPNGPSTVPLFKGQHVEARGTAADRTDDSKTWYPCQVMECYPETITYDIRFSDGLIETKCPRRYLRVNKGDIKNIFRVTEACFECSSEKERTRWLHNVKLLQEELRINLIETFHKQCGDGSLADVHARLQQGYVDAQAVNADGFTALHFAAAKDRVDIIQLLLCSSPAADLHAINKHGATALWEACRRGSTGAVKALIEYGAFVDQAKKRPGSGANGEGGETPSTTAAFHGHFGCIEALVSAGADMNKRNINDESPLLLATSRGHNDIVQLLCDYAKEAQKEAEKALLNTAELRGFSSDDDDEADEMTSAQLIQKKQREKRERAEKSRKAAARGAYLNYKQKTTGRTALFEAARTGNFDAVVKLINAGGEYDVLAKDIVGDSPLVAAAWVDNTDIVAELIERGTDIHSERENGITACYVAAREGSSESLQLLMENGADVHKLTNFGWSTLHAAAHKGHTIIISMLCAACVNAESRNARGQTALWLASACGCDSGIKVLLGVLLAELPILTELEERTIKQSVEKDLFENGWCPKHPMFAQQAEVEIHRQVQEMRELKRLEKVNMPAYDGRTPAFAAAAGGHTSSLKRLVDHGANADAPEEKNFSTPLHIAAIGNHVETVQFLIGNNCTVDPIDRFNETPLFKAAQNGFVRVVQALLDANANAHIPSSRIHGGAALYTACERGHLDVVRTLCAAGVKINKANWNSATPLFIAKQRNKKNVVEFLIGEGALLEGENENRREVHFLPPL